MKFQHDHERCVYTKKKKTWNDAAFTRYFVLHQNLTEETVLIGKKITIRDW